MLHSNSWVAIVGAWAFLGCSGSSDTQASTGGTTSTGGGASSTGGNATSLGGTGTLGGGANSGGTTASVGGTTANVGGTTANVGGKSSGVGGTSANVGGKSSGAGGTSANVGGTSATSTGVNSIPVGHCGDKKGAYFPATSWIYTDISGATVRGNSAATTKWLEDAGGWGNSNRFQIDTSFVILDADASTPRVARTTTDPIDYYSDCDPNVMMPVPAGGRIEGYADYICPGRTTGDPAGDCHMLVADFSGNTLFEAYQATYSGSTFYSGCTIAWDMRKDVWGAPPAPGSTLPTVAQRNWGIGRDCTGPDAAGFPIAPLLLTIGDILWGRVEHAIRFILPNARMQLAATSGAANTDGQHPVYVWPATHAGGPTAVDANAPIYGSRWRLKANFNPTSRGLDPNNAVVKAVVYGLQHYGMLLSDGGNIALTAEDGSDCETTWDDLWGDNGARVLNGILPSDFEVLDTGGTESGWDCTRNTR